MANNESFWSRCADSSILRRHGSIVISKLPNYVSSQETSSLSPQEASLFWQKHFGSPPRTPVLHVREEWLEADLAAGAIGLKLNNGQGTVWARPIGNFYLTKEPNYQIKTLYVEGLCLKPEARGRGYTRQLLDALGLATLKRYGPEMRFLFLKEGRSVPTKTLASDIYLYKRFSDRHRLNDTIKSPLTQEKAKEIFRTLSKKKAKSLLTNFGTGPEGSSRTNFFTDPTESCLLAITETHQHHHLDGRRLGLITGWIADPDLPPETHSLLQQYLLVRQPYTWIWTPSSYIIDHDRWYHDGIISWQPFQWEVQPAVSMDRIFIAL